MALGVRTKEQFKLALYCAQQFGYEEIEVMCNGLLNVTTIGNVGPLETILGISHKAQDVFYAQCANNTDFFLEISIAEERAEGWIHSLGWVDKGFKFVAEESFYYIFHDDIKWFSVGFKCPY